MRGSGLHTRVDDPFIALDGGNGAANGWAAQFRVKMAGTIGQPDAITAVLRDGVCNDAGPGRFDQAHACNFSDFQFISWDTLEFDGKGDRNEFNNFRVVYDPNAGGGAAGAVITEINGQPFFTADRSTPPNLTGTRQTGFGWSGGTFNEGDHYWAYFILADSIADLPAAVGPYAPTGPPPTDFTWKADRSGDWNLHGNWTPFGGPPSGLDAVDGANQTASFGDIIQSNQTVFSNTDVSVHAISFNSSNTYAIAGTGSVSLVAGTSTEPVDKTGNSIVGVANGLHQFQLNVELRNNTNVDVASDATLEFNNRLFLNGNSLIKTGAGTMAINNNVLTGGGTVTCAQGTCRGTGTISGDLNNVGGTVSPGSSGGTVSVVPEPGALMLLALGVVAWVGLPRRIARRRR